MAGITIANAPLIQSPDKQVRIPASDGSGRAGVVTLDQVATLIGQGIDLSDVAQAGIRRVDVWTRQTSTSAILELVSDEGQTIVSENIDGACRVYRSYVSGGEFRVREESDTSLVYLYATDQQPVRAFTLADGEMLPWAYKAEIPDSIPTSYIDTLISDPS